MYNSSAIEFIEEALAMFTSSISGEDTPILRSQSDHPDTKHLFRIAATNLCRTDSSYNRCVDYNLSYIISGETGYDVYITTKETIYDNYSPTAGRVYKVYVDYTSVRLDRGWFTWLSAC